MERVEGLVERFVELSELLYSAELDPDPDRRDWSSCRERVDELHERYEALLEALDDCAGELDEDELSALQLRVCHLGLGVFAALRAAGRSGQTLPLLGNLIERSRGSEDADLFAAVDRDPASGAELARLRYRLANGDLTARPALKRLAKTASESAIAAQARKLFHAPRPLRSAPPLWSFNGFGTGVFGSRDVNPADGSEIKTLCLTALFIPVFPISAYRVVDHGDRSYSFVSKNRLSTFARAYQKLAVFALIAAIGYVAINAYLTSPGRLAAKELAAADAARESGDAGAAIDGYDRLVKRYSGRVDSEVITRAASQATALRLDQIKRPLKSADLPRALTAVRAIGTYPRTARLAAGDALGRAVLDWSDDLEKAGAPEAAVTLLDAARVSLLQEQGSAVEERGRQVRTRLAAALAPRRPVEALGTFVELGATDKAGELIATLLDRPSLLREAAPLIERWLASRADNNISARLAEAVALESEPTRAAALGGDDREAIEAALAKHPGDHELTAALAELDRAAGEPREAIKRLEALGEPGWLSGSAQQTLAMAHVDAGELAVADEILGELLRYRLPSFRSASTAYQQAAGSFREALIRRVDAGSAPPELLAAVRANDESAAERFEEWAAAEMNKDERLARLRDDYQRQGIVVSASLALGTIKLQRANRADGEARDTLLAEAERTFLAIADDAAGLPSYHLGLGQVYHRLGKSAEGDAELGGLLERGDPELSLAVSGAYRELGKNSRAAEVAEKVYNTTGSPIREEAATQLSLLAEELDDKEMWLERADPSRPNVRAQLDQIQAVRASRAGQDKKAAELYRRVAAYYEKTAEHSSASANNAALAYRGIYRSTGDRRQLARARAGLEAALRLEPANALVVGNLAEHTHFEGWLEVLSKELPTGVLRLESDDVQTLIDRLDRSSPAIKRGLTSALLRRSAQLTTQQTVLAPSDGDGWQRAITRASRGDDVEALESIARQLERASVDTSADAKAYADWASGKRDQQLGEQLAAATARHGAMLEAARGSGSRRAIAAARFLLAGSLAAKGWMSAEIEPLETAYEHAVAAREGWPELGDTTASIALQLAIVRAGKSRVAIETIRESGYRDYSPVIMLVEALLGDDAAAVRAALASDPAIAATARWLAGASDLEPELAHWVIGVVSGDQTLARRGATRLRERRYQIAARLAVVLAPHARSAAARARLYAKPETLER